MGKVGLIDYGAGNFTSVRNALEHIQVDYVPINSANQLRDVAAVILPGVGAFKKCMARLEQHGFVEELHEQVVMKSKPFLGICVGMQILAEVGHEFEPSNGLGFLAGSVERLDSEESGLPVPHMGWNEVRFQRRNELTTGLGENPCFYFVHSYAFVPKDAHDVLATCEYGHQFTACVQRGNIFGVQFHPEKSQYEGLRLLKNFCKLG